MAGLIVALSILASIVVPGVKWVAFAIGAGLAFAALTNTCAMGMLLARLPYNRGATCDLRTVVAQLVDSQQDESEPTAMIALTIVLAVFVGISLGLLGGGGSILTVPLLAYVAGMDAKQAIATSLLVVGVTSAVGAISHARAGRVQWRPAWCSVRRAWPVRMPAAAGPIHPGHGAADRLRGDHDRHRGGDAART